MKKSNHSAQSAWRSERKAVRLSTELDVPVISAESIIKMLKETVANLSGCGYKRKIDGKYCCTCYILTSHSASENTIYTDETIFH